VQNNQKQWDHEKVKVQTNFVVHKINKLKRQMLLQHT